MNLMRKLWQRLRKKRLGDRLVDRGVWLCAHPEARLRSCDVCDRVAREQRLAEYEAKDDMLRDMKKKWENL